MPSNHLILCCPLLLLPSIFPSIEVFSSESVLCVRWPKYWSFSFSISLSNQYSGLISFRIDWFDLAVQGTLKSLLQHRNLKASILQHSVFFMVQLSHLYMTTMVYSFDYTYLWRRQWHPTPVLLPGKSHGWRSLIGYSPWGRKVSDTTERLHMEANMYF